jgi:hypothetical protein
MKKMKLSPFWMGIAVAGGVLVVAFALLVVPKMAEETKFKKQVKAAAVSLSSARENTPSRADIESWTKYRAELVRSYGDITKFYADSDKYLERWLPGLQFGGDGMPTRDSFITRFRDAGRDLEKKLIEEHKVKIIEEETPDNPLPAGKKPWNGFNWEDIQPADWGKINSAGAEDEKAVLHELQKRFWARQRVANMVLSNAVKVSRIVDFRFFKRLHPSLNSGPWELPRTGADLIHWQGVGIMAGSSGNFQETDLPNELGKTMTFGFALELPYSEVPKAIREIITPGNEATTAERMLVNLIGTHITIRDQNEPSKEAVAKPVLLAVTCQIIDFDPTKVKKFDAKQQ